MKEAVNLLENNTNTNDYENNSFYEVPLVRLPGFEPGLGAWGAPVLDQTGPQPL